MSIADFKMSIVDIIKNAKLNIFALSIIIIIYLSIYYIHKLFYKSIKPLLDSTVLCDWD